MSPAVADFQSSSSSTRFPIFQNPNLTAQKEPTDTYNLNNASNFMDSSKLEFNSSNDASAAAAAAPIRSSRKKHQHLKVKKRSNCRDSVSTKPVIGTDDNVSFVFNANASGSVFTSSLGQSESGEQRSVDEFVNSNEFGFMLGATNDSKLAKEVGSKEVGNSGDEFCFSNNLKFVFGKDEKTETRKVSERVGNEFRNKDKDFVFVANMSNGVTTETSSSGGYGHGSDGVALRVDQNESGGVEDRSYVDRSMKVNNMTFETDSVLANWMSILNLETRGPGKEGGALVNESQKGEENGKSICRTFEKLNFVFCANHRDIEADSNVQKEHKEKVGRPVPNGSDKVKLDAKVDFSTSNGADSIYGNSDRSESDRKTEKTDFSDSGNLKTMQRSRKFDDSGFEFGAGSHDIPSAEDLGKKDLRTNLEKVNFGDKIKGSVDTGKMNILNNKGAENFSDYLKKRDSDMDFALDGNYKFVLGSNNIGSAFNKSSLFTVSDETRTSNIHDPLKFSATNASKDSNCDSCAHFNNLFGFESNKRHVPSSGRSATTSVDQLSGINLAGTWSEKAVQKTDEVDKVPAYEYSEKSDKVTKVHAFTNTETPGSDGVGVPKEKQKSYGSFIKENRSINQNEQSSDGDQYFGNQSKKDAEVIKDSCPSPSLSTKTGLDFIPKVGYPEATPTSRVEITKDFNFTSKVCGSDVSSTGFSTSTVNMTSFFMPNKFLGSSKEFEFSTGNSAAGRKLKKTRAKLGKQAKSNQQRARHTRLSKEVNSQSLQESPGCCSPMDFSPFCSAVSGQTSPNPSASSASKNKDAVEDTTEKLSEINFSSSATSFANVDVPTKQRPRQKKYRMKIGCDLESKTPKRRVDATHTRERTSQEHTKATDQEACGKWRTRGNQAYRNGDFSKAEVYYTKGINSMPCSGTRGFCFESLLLCYSNRAATHMALGRMREGLADCRMAAALDPKFVKADLRSANCHLLLGEVEDAFYNYNKCLESKDNVCLDRRIAIEAADGLQKAQKVADYLKLSAELLQQNTNESATKALGIIADALSISCYSEKLLKMKGEALSVLWKHEEVVQLCEQTLDSAEKNFAIVHVTQVNVDGYDCKSYLKLWRWNLMSKSYFHLGRLEIALELVEKHEQLRPTAYKTEESLVPLAVTIREILHCKNAGNEAFQGGRHTEAVELYTSAISKSIGSHSFASVCFCNRAAAHQSLGEIIDAIGDCSIAIALDGSYPKALSRRATLHEMIRDYKQAADDLQRLISVLEKQSGEKSQKSGTPGRSTGGSVKDLRRACRRLSSMNEKAKKGRSLDLYLILGVKASDTASEIKKAYHKAALRHHPDKASQIIARTESGADGKEIAKSIHEHADRLFKMIGEAYAVLSDSTKRSKYDLDEEMWDDMDATDGSSYRRASDSYSSPYETTNMRRSQESRKTYGNSHYYYWQDPQDTYGKSHPRW